VILISTGAEADYRDLIEDSPAAGFLAKSELSVLGISQILGRTPQNRTRAPAFSAPGPRSCGPTQPATCYR
jgi:hypothetical protein